MAADTVLIKHALHEYRITQRFGPVRAGTDRGWRALQRQWPDARITWIIGKGEHSLLAGLSGVEFVVYDKATRLAGMREIWRRLDDTQTEE